MSIQNQVFITILLTLLAAIFLLFGIWSGDSRWSETAGVIGILVILDLVVLAFRGENL